MPKKKNNAASKTKEGLHETATESTVEVVSRNTDEPVPQSTFTAASGKFYATACGNYPEADDFTEEFTCDVVGAAAGDLLEVLAIHGDWAYGRRFKPRQDFKLEGVFRLEWVVGVKLVLEAGKRKPVEIDIRSEEYGFKEPKANDTAGKLQAKRFKKRIEDAAEIWNNLEAKAANDVVANQEASAAKFAERLEMDEAESRARKKREEERRDAILAEVRQRKAEAEFAKKQAIAEAERIRLAEQKAQEAIRLEQIARLKMQQEAEEARCRAILEEQARREAEHAESKRLEREVEGVGDNAEVALIRQGNLPDSEGQEVSPMACTRRGQETLLDTPSTSHDHQSNSETSCDGLNQSSDCMKAKRRTGLQKKTITRKFRRPSTELEAVTDEWEKVQADMANKSSDLATLEEKVNSLLQSQGSDCSQQIGPPPGLELMSEAERNAAEVNVLKQRVFQAMLKTKRLAGFEQRTSVVLKKKVFQAMFSAKRSLSPTSDKEAEMKALQLKNLMKRAFKGMRDSRSIDGPFTPRGLTTDSSPDGLLSPESNQGDLEMLAEQVVEQLQTKAESIKAQIRNGFLRAHRAGELLELRHELDELADSVSQMGAKLGSGTGLELASPDSPKTSKHSWQATSGISLKKRWSEYTSGESESDVGRSPPQPAGDFSDSDRENKRDRRWGSAASRILIG